MSEKETSASHAQAIALQNRRMMGHRSFWGHLWDVITHTPLYSHWKQILTYLRRLRAVTVTLRILTVLLAILETGALVLVSTAIFLVILPLLIAMMTGIFITAAIESVKSNRILKNGLREKRVCVLFMPRDVNPFFSRHARTLATEGFTVLVVSPYWISAKSLTKTSEKAGFYCTFRKEEQNLYLIRRYYLFSLRKRVLSKCNVSYLY